MDAAAIDQIRLNFSPQALVGLNVVIGLMMLGVSLDLKLADFKRVIVSPVTGLYLPSDTDHSAGPVHGPGHDPYRILSRRKPLQYNDLPGQGKCRHFDQHDRHFDCCRHFYDPV
jgi:hypothetical protein